MRIYVLHKYMCHESKRINSSITSHSSMMENEIPSVQSPGSIDEYVEIAVDEINEEIPHSNIAEYNTFNQSIDTAEKRVAAET